MEFSWTEDQRAFRRQVQEFLARELPGDWETIARKSPGSKEMTEFSRSFCPKLAAAGLLVPHWPAEYGGRDAPPWEHFVLGELMWEVGEPRGPQYYNVNWIGPAIMRYGTPEQKALHLSLMSAGTVIWSQGFSEPSAGSDLASLRTRAERQNGKFLLNGSKIWTSYAALSEYCFLLARVPGEEGEITVFLMPMDRPGITVRPIRSVVGDGDLHEVFFDNVTIEEDEVLGGVGQGWKVARYALHFERVGIPRYALAARILDRTVEQLQRNWAFDESARQEAACAYAACEAARMLTYGVVDRRARDLGPDGTTSVARYATVQAENRVAEFVLDFQPELLAGETAPMVETHHRRAIAAGIASGAAEIQLNLIARDVLGLDSAMLLELSDEQTLLRASLDKMAEKYRQPPADHAAYVQYSEALQRELAEAGFLEIARTEGYGPLDAALLVEQIARLPCSVEVAASALVGSALGRELSGPLALCEAIGRPTRFLPQARHVCLIAGDKVEFADLDGDQVRPVDSVIAYPLGVLSGRPAGSVTLDDDLADRVQTLWRIALAAEAAGLMRGALDLTVTYVKDRHQFKQPLGNFQAIQHRLAADEQIVSASFLLAMRAAFTLDPKDAATAALYVQQQMRTIIYDCHQFTGAMGVTLEYPLHLWTYRLKFIQGELGGRAAQARALADLVWRERMEQPDSAAKIA